MATARPRRPPPLDPVGDPAVDPVGDPEHDPAVDPIGGPDLDPPPPNSRGQEDDLSRNSDLVGGAVTTHGRVSPPQDQLPENSRNKLKVLVSQFLGFPIIDCQEVFFDTVLPKKYPSLGIERGYLSYYAHAPLAARTDAEDELTLFQKFALWMKKKADPYEESELVHWLLDRSGIKNILVEDGSCGPAVVSRIYPTLRVIVQSMKSIQKQIPKVQNSVSKIEIASAEGNKVLGEVLDTTSRIENIMKEAIKSAEIAEKHGSAEAGESVVIGFVQKLKHIEDHELSTAMKQIDKVSELVDIPANLKRRFDEVKGHLDILKGLVSGVTAACGVSALKPVVPLPDPRNPDSGSSTADSQFKKPVPVVQVPVIPFDKIGKDAIDVLSKNFLGEVAYHGEMRCTFNKQLNPSLTVRASSSPNLCAKLKHGELWGSNLKGNLRVVLPFKDRLDAKGAVVPFKETCVAELLYARPQACLSGTIGMHGDPAVGLSAMFGTSAPFFGTTAFSGGGRLSFSSAKGTVTGLDAGLSITNPEWGTVSATAALLEKNRGLKVYYNQKVLKKNTIAAELDYNHQKKSVVVSAGLEHQYDRSMLMKAMVRSDGMAQALVQTQEGIAGSTVRASVKVDLRNLRQAPRVGFSISTNPTWG